MKKNQIFAIIFYIFAAIYLVGAIASFRSSVIYVQQISQQQAMYGEVIDPLDILTYMIGNCGPFFFYSLSCFALGWIFSGRLTMKAFSLVDGKEDRQENEGKELESRDEELKANRQEEVEREEEVLVEVEVPFDEIEEASLNPQLDDKTEGKVSSNPSEEEKESE